MKSRYGLRIEPNGLLPLGERQGRTQLVLRREENFRFQVQPTLRVGVSLGSDSEVAQSPEQ